MLAAKQMVAREAFICEHDGREVIVRAGERFPSTHPLVKAHAGRFAPADAEVK